MMRFIIIKCENFKIMFEVSKLLKGKGITNFSYNDPQPHNICLQKDDEIKRKVLYKKIKDIVKEYEKENLLTLEKVEYDL